MNRVVVVALVVSALAACSDASPPLAAAATKTPAPAAPTPTPALPTAATPAPTSASASTLWSAAQPFVVAPRNTQTLGEVLWPLAFTADGHLVTLSALEDDGQGGVRFRLRAHNLDNDSETVLAQWHSDGDLKDPAAAFRGIDPARTADLERFLAGRQAQSPGMPKPAPLSRQGDTFRVLVDAPKPVGRLRSEAEQLETRKDGMQAQRFKVSLVSDQRGEKVLGNIDGLVDETGQWYRRALEQAWFLVSPFEPRAAVLVQIDSRGFEGPPNPQTLQVLGAHLETRFQR